MPRLSKVGQVPFSLSVLPGKASGVACALRGQQPWRSDLVDDFVAAVVARAWEAFRVLVCEGAAQRLHDGRRREVLAGDELNALAESSTAMVWYTRVSAARLNGTQHEGSVCTADTHSPSRRPCGPASHVAADASTL